MKRLIGYMPDTFGSYDNMRVSEYLDFFGAAFGIPRRARVRRIDEVLDTDPLPGLQGPVRREPQPRHAAARRTGPHAAARPRRC